MKSKNLPRAACAVAGVFAAIPALQTATIRRSANHGAGNQSDQAAHWSGSAVQAGNDYQTGAGFRTSNHASTLKGRAS